MSDNDISKAPSARLNKTPDSAGVSLFSAIAVVIVLAWATGIMPATLFDKRLPENACEVCRGTGKSNDRCFFCRGHGDYGGKSCERCKGTGKYDAGVGPFCAGSGNGLWTGIVAYFLANAFVLGGRWAALFLMGIGVAAILHGLYEWLQSIQSTFAILMVVGSFLLFFGYLRKLRMLAGNGQSETVSEQQPATP